MRLYFKDAEFTLEDVAGKLAEISGYKIRAEKLRSSLQLFMAEERIRSVESEKYKVTAKFGTLRDIPWPDLPHPAKSAHSEDRFSAKNVSLPESHRSEMQGETREKRITGWGEADMGLIQQDLETYGLSWLKFKTNVGFYEEKTTGRKLPIHLHRSTGLKVIQKHIIDPSVTSEVFQRTLRAIQKLIRLRKEGVLRGSLIARENIIPTFLSSKPKLSDFYFELDMRQFGYKEVEELAAGERDAKGYAEKMADVLTVFFNNQGLLHGHPNVGNVFYNPSTHNYVIRDWSYLREIETARRPEEEAKARSEMREGTREANATIDFTEKLCEIDLGKSRKAMILPVHFENYEKENAFLKLFAQKLLMAQEEASNEAERDVLGPIPIYIVVVTSGSDKKLQPVMLVTMPLPDKIGPYTDGYAMNALYAPVSIPSAQSLVSAIHRKFTREKNGFYDEMAAKDALPGYLKRFHFGSWVFGAERRVKNVFEIKQMEDSAALPSWLRDELANRVAVLSDIVLEKSRGDKGNLKIFYQIARPNRAEIRATIPSDQTAGLILKREGLDYSLIQKGQLVGHVDGSFGFVQTASQLTRVLNKVGLETVSKGEFLDIKARRKTTARRKKASYLNFFVSVADPVKLEESISKASLFQQGLSVSGARSELRERQVFENGDLTTEKTVRGRAVFLSEDQHDFQWAMTPGGEEAAEAEYAAWFKIVHDGINELFLPALARHLKIYIQKKHEDVLKGRGASSNPTLETSHIIALVLGAVQDGIARGDLEKKMEKGSSEESLFLKYMEDMARILRVQRQIVVRSGEPEEAEKIIKRQFSIALELVQENIAKKDEAMDSHHRRLALFLLAERELAKNEKILQQWREEGVPLDEEYREDLEEKNKHFKKILEAKDEVLQAEERFNIQKMLLQSLETDLKLGIESKLYSSMKNGDILSFVIYNNALKTFLQRLKGFDIKKKATEHDLKAREYASRVAEHALKPDETALKIALKAMQEAEQALKVAEHGYQSNYDSGMLYHDLSMALVERLEQEMLEGTTSQEKKVSVISDGTQRILFVRRPISANEILREFDRYGADLVGIVATQSSASAHWAIVVRGMNFAPPILFLSEMKNKAKLDKVQLNEDVLLTPGEQNAGQGVLKTNPSGEDLEKALRSRKEEELLARGEFKISQFPLGVDVGVNLSTHDIGDPRASGANHSGLARTDFLDTETKNEIGHVGESIGSGEFKFSEWLQVLEKLNFDDMRNKKEVDALMNNFVDVLSTKSVERIRTLLGHLRAVYGRFLRDPFFEDGGVVPFRTLDLQGDSKNKELLDSLKRLHAQYPQAGVIRFSPEELKKDVENKEITGFKFYQNSKLGKFFLIWQVTALLIEYAHYLDSTKQKDPVKLGILFPMVSSPEQLEFLQREILPMAQKLAVLNFPRNEDWNIMSFREVQAKIQKASDQVSYGMMVEVMEILKSESLMDSVIRNPFVEFYDVGTNDLEKELWESIAEGPVDRDLRESQELFGRLMPDLVLGLDKFATKLTTYNKEASGDPVRKQKRMCICGQMGGNQKFLALVERWRRLNVPISVSVSAGDVRQVRHTLLRYSRVPQSSLNEIFKNPNYIDRRAGKIAKQQMLISKKFIKLAEAWQERYARLGYYHGFYRDSMDPVMGIGSFQDVLAMRDIFKLFEERQVDFPGADDAIENDDMTQEEFEKFLNREKEKGEFFDEYVCKALLSSFDFLKNVREIYREMQIKDPQKFKEPFNLYTGNLNDFLEAYEGKFGKQDWLARTDPQQRQDQFFRRYYTMANNVYTALTGIIHEKYEDLFGTRYEDLGLVEEIHSGEKEEAIPLHVQLRSGMFFKREMGFIYRRVKELYIPQNYEQIAFERFSKKPGLMLEIFRQARVDATEEVRISYSLQKILRRAIRAVGSVPSGEDEALFEKSIKEFFAFNHDISYPLWRMHRFGFFSKFLPDYDAMPNYFPGDGRRTPVHIQTLNSMEFLEKLFSVKDFAFLRAGLVFQKLKTNPEALTTLRLSLLTLGIVRAKLRLKPGDVPAPADIKKIVSEVLAKFGIPEQSLQVELIVWLIEKERTLSRNDLSAPEKIQIALEAIFLDEGKDVSEEKWDMLYLLTFAMRAGRAEHEKLVMLKREGPDSSLANCDKLYLAGSVLIKFSIPPQDFEGLVKITQRLVREGSQESDQQGLLPALTGEKVDLEQEISEAWADFSRMEADILIQHEKNEILPAKYKEAIHREIIAMVHSRAAFKAMFRKYEKMVTRYYWKGLDPATLIQQLICCVSLEVLQRKKNHTPIVLFEALPQHYTNAFEIVFGRVSEDPGLLAIYSYILYKHNFSIETVNIQRENGREGKFIVRFMGSFPREEQDLKAVMATMRKDLADFLGGKGDEKKGLLGLFEKIVRFIYRWTGPTWGLPLFAANQRNNPLFFRNIFNRYGDLIVQRSTAVVPALGAEIDFFEEGEGRRRSYDTLVISTEDRRGLTALVTNYLSLIRGLSILDFSFEDTMGEKAKMIVHLSYPQKEIWLARAISWIVRRLFFWRVGGNNSKYLLSGKEKTQIKEKLKEMLDGFEVAIHRGHILNTYDLKINASGTVSREPFVEKAPEASPEPSPSRGKEPVVEEKPKENKAPESSVVETDDMLARSYTVQGSHGLHSLPASKLAGFAHAQTFLSTLIVEQNGAQTNMKSIVSLLELEGLMGEHVVIRITPKPEATPEQIQGVWTWLENFKDYQDDRFFFSKDQRSEMRKEDSLQVKSPLEKVLEDAEVDSYIEGLRAKENLEAEMRGTHVFKELTAYWESLRKNPTPRTLDNMMIAYRDLAERYGGDQSYASDSPEALIKSPQKWNDIFNNKITAVQAFSQLWADEANQAELRSEAEESFRKTVVAEGRDMLLLWRLRQLVNDPKTVQDIRDAFQRTLRSEGRTEEVKKDGLEKARERYKRVLVVDDEASLALLMKRVLMSLGLGSQAMDVVHSGEEALSKLLTGKYDLVVTDVNLNENGKVGKDGDAVLLEAAALGITGFHAIFVSGRDAERVMGRGEEFKKANIPHRVLGKPYRLQQLEDAIRELAATESFSSEQETSKIAQKLGVNDAVDGQTLQGLSLSQFAQQKQLFAGAPRPNEFNIWLDYSWKTQATSLWDMYLREFHYGRTGNFKKFVGEQAQWRESKGQLRGGLEEVNTRLKDPGQHESLLKWAILVSLEKEYEETVERNRRASLLFGNSQWNVSGMDLGDFPFIPVRWYLGDRYEIQEAELGQILGGRFGELGSRFYELADAGLLKSLREVAVLEAEGKITVKGPDEQKTSPKAPEHAGQLELPLFPRSESRIMANRTERDRVTAPVRAEVRLAGTEAYKASLENTTSSSLALPVQPETQAVIHWVTERSGGVYSQEEVASLVPGSTPDQIRVWIANQLLEAFRAQRSAKGEINNPALQKVIESLERYKVTGEKDPTLESREVHVALPLLSQAKLEALAEFAPVLLAFAVSLNARLFLNVQGAAPKGLEQNFLDRAKRNGITVAQGQFRIFGVSGSEGNLFKSLGEPGVREDVLLAGEEKSLPENKRATLWYNSPKAQEDMESLASEIAEALYAALDQKVSKGSRRNISEHYQELSVAIGNAIQASLKILVSA
ncbi:MAG: putative PEP-binding protein [Candidatus Omnitrophota bacterium]